MKQKYFLLLFLFLNTAILFSQDNSIFYTRTEIADTNENKLFFNINTTSFLKNNEYFDTIVKQWELETLKGWTGIGFMLKPKLVYQPSKTTSIEAGYFLEKFSGRNNFYKPVPLFRVRQMLTGSLELVFGQLYGSLEHRLGEPVYRFDRYYSDNVEYGIQFLFSNRYFTNDLWLNWEKFIFYDDPFKEEFVLGNVANFKYDINTNWKLNIPFHYTWTHAGGQIDRRIKNRDHEMSLNNIMTGIDIGYLYGKKLFKSINFSYLYYNYSAGANPPSGEKFHQLFDEGYGYYFKTNIDFGSIKLMLGYWKAHNFIARRGEYIFESIYEYLPGESISDKSLYTFKFIYDKKIKKNIVFSMRTDMYYRPGRSNMDYSYAFYFIYNDLFLIKKVMPVH
jgi:hypothetical protein